jgi:hypothetical protein
MTAAAVRTKRALSFSHADNERVQAWRSARRVLEARARNPAEWVEISDDSADDADSDCVACHDNDSLLMRLPNTAGRMCARCFCRVVKAAGDEHAVEFVWARFEPVDTPMQPAAPPRRQHTI